MCRLFKGIHMSGFMCHIFLHSTGMICNWCDAITYFYSVAAEITMKCCVRITALQYTNYSILMQFFFRFCSYLFVSVSDISLYVTNLSHHVTNLSHYFSTHKLYCSDFHLLIHHSLTIFPQTWMVSTLCSGSIWSGVVRYIDSWCHSWYYCCSNTHSTRCVLVLFLLCGWEYS